MNHIYLDEPIIQKDSVTFNWRFSDEQNIFKKTEFSIKYEGLDIESVKKEVFVEIFISLILPVLKSFDEEFIIFSPLEISNYSVDFWLNYNEVDNVKVFPTVNRFESTNSNNILPNKKVGIFFGGGKDSLIAYNLHKEIFGEKNLLVISYTFPLNIADFKKLDQRRENFSLSKIQNDNVKVQKISTDFRTIFKQIGDFNNIHTLLYYIMSYPLYKIYGLSYVTYSYEFTHYWNVNNKGERQFFFKKSRPEFDNYISEYLSKTLNYKFKIFNSNNFISENLAFKLLKERYNVVENLMMCESVSDPNIKWCKKCNKCGEFVLYNLANKNEISEFDVNEFLTSSTYIEKLIRETSEFEQNRNENGNVIWFDSLITPLHYMSFCHMIYKIDLTFWKTRLSEEAINNLLKLKNWFGNKEYPILDSYLLNALKSLNLDFEQEIIKILTPYAEPVIDDVIPILYGNNQMLIDYRLLYDITKKSRNNLSNIKLSRSLVSKSSFELEKYEFKAIGYNNVTKEEIDFVFRKSYLGHTLYIDKTAPKKDDAVEISINFDNLIVGKSYHLTLTLLSPYQSDLYKNRFKYEVYFDNKVIVDEDIAFWNNENIINLYFIASKKFSELKIKVTSLYNAEPWNWGKAAQIVIRDLAIRQCENIKNNIISASSPFSKINNWSEI